jgi:hypothetical protein
MLGDGLSSTLPTPNEVTPKPNRLSPTKNIRRCHVVDRDVGAAIACDDFAELLKRLCAVNKKTPNDACPQGMRLYINGVAQSLER